MMANKTSDPSDPRRELRKLIRADKKYIRLRQAFETLPQFQLPIEDMHKDILTTHKTRTIRRLNTRANDFIDKVVEAAAGDINSRGRLTEIMVVSLKASRQLKLAIETLSDYLVSQYGDRLRRIASTKGERDKFIETLLRDFINYVAKADTLREAAAMVIADIDKDGYGLRVIVDTLRITNKYEGQL